MDLASCVPPRLSRDPIVVEDRATVCPEEEFRAMRAESCEPLGWDERGVPRAASIEDLGLEAILGAAEFERMGGVAMAGQRPRSREGSA